MQQLDKLVQDYYRSQTLAPGRVEAILQAAQEGQPNRQPRSSRPAQLSQRLWPAMAASLLICLSAVLLHLHLTARSVTELVLDEVAMNHREGLALEVMSDRYQTVQESLDQLRFALRPPTAGGLPENTKLLGGRYCSIYGKLAAQLKLSDPSTGRIYTLFVTLLTPSLKDIGRLQQRNDGVDIKLWRENELFYALASG